MLEYNDKVKRSDALNEDKGSVLTKWMILGIIIEETARTLYSDGYMHMVVFCMASCLL